MNLVNDPGQRCGNCGTEHPNLIRFERGGPYCLACISLAQDMLSGVDQTIVELMLKDLPTIRDLMISRGWTPPADEDLRG